tara:strand:+ start:39 stop:542 length:504 start_codon:yes stop_codon:yes gene_type:complete
LIDLKEIKNNILKKENFYFLIIILFIFSLDRYSKIRIINDFSDTSFYLNDFLNFDLTWNTGIGFGLLSTSSNVIYNLVTLIISSVIIFLVYFILKSERFDKFCFSLIISGALGNLYDRFFFNAVPDFIDFHYKNVHWFTFNVADIFITLGIAIFLMKDMIVKKYEKT